MSCPPKEKLSGMHAYLQQGCIRREGASEGGGVQKWLDRRLEEVAKAVGGGYCRLQMRLRLALGVRETVAGHRPGAGRGGGLPPLPMHPCPPDKGNEDPKELA